MTFWKASTRDKVKNGTFLGGLLGFAIWQGANIYTWLIETIPSVWMKLGEFSLPLYLIGAGALVGYIIDKY